MTPLKYPHFLHTPNNNSENPKNIEIQNYESKKMGQVYVGIYMKISEPHSPGLIAPTTLWRN